MARTVFSLLFLILAVAAWWAGDDMTCYAAIIMLFLCNIEGALSCAEVLPVSRAHMHAVRSEQH